MRAIHTPSRPSDGVKPKRTSYEFRLFFFAIVFTFCLKEHKSSLLDFFFLKARRKAPAIRETDRSPGQSLFRHLFNPQNPGCAFPSCRLSIYHVDMAPTHASAGVTNRRAYTCPPSLNQLVDMFRIQKALLERQTV
jgi:hypothetical protein